MNNFFSKTFEKIIRFSSEVTRTDEIELVVVPSQNTNEPSTSSTVVTKEHFKFVDNLMNYFESTEVSNLLNDTSKVLLFKLKIANIVCKLNSTELNELADKFTKNSVIIFLATKNDQNYFLCWKSLNIQKFLILKIDDNYEFVNYLKIFEFVVEFLINSLRQGHLGLHSDVKIDTTSLIEIHLFADHRNYNLLLIAAEVGDPCMVDFCLNEGCRTKSVDTNAQSLAYNGQHFHVLLSLLKSNLTYPQLFKIEGCPDYINDFYEVSRDLHEAIIKRNSYEVLKILKNNPEMRHFYNLKNESAPAFALRHKLLDMYGLLISNNISLGENEKFSDVKKKLKPNELEKLREIHFDESKFLPDNHMHVLISNSRLAPATTEHEEKYKIIQDAFNTLNSNAFIQIILMVVAASRYFRVVFDFNRDSIEHIDPTANATSRGMFYSFGRIYIASKQLLDPATKFEALGTLAHELCHYAVNLVYWNDAKPYFSNNLEAATQFGDISTICYNNREQEEIIKLVYDCYSSNERHAELIVRVPHLIMQYTNDPNKFQEVLRNFSKLFNFYKDKVMPEMENALPNIEMEAEREPQEKRSMIRCLALMTLGVGFLALVAILSGILIGYILYTPFYEFNDLSSNEQKLVVNSPIIYKNVEIKFSDLFPENSIAYTKLISDHISLMLDKTPLNFSDPHFHYLSQLATHNWQNLTTKLKDKIFNSNFTFQNESLKFEKLYEIHPEVFNALNSSQIIDILSDNELFVHKMIANDTEFYVERNFFFEHIYSVYYLFKMKIKDDNETLYKSNFMRNETSQRIKFFEDFFQEFDKKDIFTQLRAINMVKEDPDFKNLKRTDFIVIPVYDILDSLDLHKFLHFGFDKVREMSNETKMFILSAEAGTGKTATFEQFTMRIKREFPTMWVSYIDFKDFKDLYKDVQTLKDVVQMLITIFNLDPKDLFQIKFFEESFKSGNVVLLWNGFDEISPEYSESVIRILKMIKSNTTIIQFICTRPLYSDRLSKEFKIKTYTLIPFDKEDQKKFIYSFLISRKIEETKIPDYTLKVQKIALSADSEELFDTPLLLLLIADLISNDVQIYESENLFEIYKKFIQKKIKLWFDQTEFGKKFSSSLVVEHRHFDMTRVYQSYALKNEFQIKHDSNTYYYCLKLQLMREKVPIELTSDEISRMGLMYINGPKKVSFTHRTFAEFFIAQYLIENIYNAGDKPTEKEADLRIMILEGSLNISGIFRFLKSFFQTIKTNETSAFDPQISNLLITKYQKLIIFKLELYGGLQFPVLFDFFKKDLKVLKKLLGIGETETAYTSIFSHAFVQSFQTTDYINDNVFPLIDLVQPYLSEDEFNSYINGKNQKGIIQYSLYAIRMFGIRFDITHKNYKIDNKLFKIYDAAKAFKEIAKNLTNDEIKEFFKSKVALRSIYFLQNIRNMNDGFNENIWNLLEDRFTVEEQKQVVRNFFDIFPKAITSVNMQHTLQFYLKKLDKFFSKDEIFKVLSELEIEQEKLDYSNFYFLWTSFVNRTSFEQQKSYLSKKIDNSNILLDSAFCLDSEILPDVVKIYELYFNRTEIQKFFLNSDDFLPLLVFRNDGNENFIDYLPKFFTGNETLLKEFLTREIDSTNLNLFDLYSVYFGPLKKLENFQIC